MGWGKAMAFIASATGDNSRAWMWLACDFMEGIEERKRREENRQIEEWNRKNAIGPDEYSRLSTWCWGEEFCSNYKETGLDEQLIHQWNRRHGHTLQLYYANGWEHNIAQMCYLWIKVGKP